MKIQTLYKWIADSKSDFTNHFKNNDTLFKQAEDYWEKLDGLSNIILIIMIVLGIVMAYSYYKPYNNKPGRHYHPKHWVYFLMGTFILSLLFTFVFEYISAPPKLDGTKFLLLKIALGNAIYASGLYVFVSVLWCNCFPTNAYRLFKFIKK